jgi:hypothetical protein
MELESIISRARTLLSYKTDAETHTILVDSGIDRGDAFLAIKAALILNMDEDLAMTKYACLAGRNFS